MNAISSSMKHYFIAFSAMLLASVSLFAAVDMQSREMKQLVKAVEKLREAKNGSKLSFNGAQSTAKAKLKAARMKNSGPEIDGLAAEIEEISVKYWGGVNADLEAQRQSGKTDHEFSKVMKSIVSWPRNYWIDCRGEEGRAKAKASRDDFAARVDKVLADQFKPYLAGQAGRGGVDFNKDIDRELQVISNELNAIKQAVLDAHGTEGFSSYNKILAWQAYLSGLLRMYPQKTKYQGLLGRVNAEIAGLGSENAFETRWKANSKVFIGKVRMPAARNKDPLVIEEVRNAFNKSGNTAEILKIHVTTTQWTVIRNALTSVIEGRTQEAAIATKQSGGECLLYNVTIYQQYDGSVYTPARMYGFSNVEIECRNVK
jgi:hypothetical protein